MEPIPFGVARRVSEGDAATVVTWSAAVPVVTKGAELLAAEGIEVELLDLRTIWPWDQDAVIASVKRTRRVLVGRGAREITGHGAERGAPRGGPGGAGNLETAQRPPG